jgi:hypothetical protein
MPTGHQNVGDDSCNVYSLLASNTDIWFARMVLSTVSYSGK